MKDPMEIPRQFVFAALTIGLLLVPKFAKAEPHVIEVLADKDSR
jgi:hypothetical protein